MYCKKPMLDKGMRRAPIANQNKGSTEITPVKIRNESVFIEKVKI